MFSGFSSEGELGRFIREARDFLFVAKHLEKKVNEHDERMKQNLATHSIRQWQQLSQEFDIKMGALMQENERRLKEVLNLQEERV